MHADLHVGLAGAEEHIAHQHIVDFLRVRATGRLQRIGTAGRHGGQGGAPLSAFIGMGGGRAAA